MKNCSKCSFKFTPAWWKAHIEKQRFSFWLIPWIIAISFDHFVFSILGGRIRLKRLTYNVKHFCWQKNRSVIVVDYSNCTENKSAEVLLWKLCLNFCFPAIGRDERQKRNRLLPIQSMRGAACWGIYDLVVKGATCLCFLLQCLAGAQTWRGHDASGW